MLFVSVKKYNAVKSDLAWSEDCYRTVLGHYKNLLEEKMHLESLRTLDKECIQALMGLLISNHEFNLGVYEKSLVDQTLNQ